MTQHIDLRRYIAITSRYRAVVFLSARVSGQAISIWINDHKNRQIGSTNSTKDNEKELNSMVHIASSYIIYY